MRYNATITVQETPEELFKSIKSTDRNDEKSEMETIHKSSTMTIKISSSSAPALRACINAKLQLLTVSEGLEGAGI
ncbi:hypothetical protein HY483_04375 [Candidatus Woesearchaeota archaeon]|nr:hypothetical protein [Candidatus Woesearchaeota archaeon]